MPVEGQWPLRRELQMREEADSESDLRQPQVPHRYDTPGPGAGAEAEAALANLPVNARHHAVPQCQ